jgi:hypothetical protein
MVPPCTAAAPPPPPPRTSRAAHRKSSLQSPELSSGIGLHHHDSHTSLTHRKHRLCNPQSTVTLQPDR